MSGPSFLDGPITATGKLVTPLTLSTYAVATVSTASEFTGAIIYVSNGAAGNPIVAFSDGTNWLRTDTRTAVAIA